jgi:hypothetical protein
MTDTHGHRTIREAADCPQCRQRNIDVVRGGPHAFLLRYFDEHATTGQLTICSCGCGKLMPEPDYEHPDAIAFVRDWTDDPVTTAWATGCAISMAVGIDELPVDVLERAGVPLFTLLEPPASTAALDALTAAMRG